MTPAIEARRLYGTGRYSIRQLAKRFRVGYGTAWKWVQLGAPPRPPAPALRRRPEPTSPEVLALILEGVARQLRAPGREVSR